MKLLLVALLNVALCIGRADMGTPPNTLSPTEKNDGFELLFDGKSMSKFDVHEGQKRWSVVDGAIKSNSTEGAGDLLTKEDFANFVLKAEFRADPDIHAHILLRKGRGKSGGYELQIKDKDPKRTAHGYLTASIPNVGRAPADTKILPGQWNSLDLTMNGTHMVVIYNGRKVVDANDSKLSSGAIALSLATPEDAPGENIEFRNLKVKRLP
jgi:hypothetical protein